MIALQPNARRALAQVGVHSPRVDILMRTANKIIEGGRPCPVEEFSHGSVLLLRRHLVSSRRHRPQVWVHEIIASDEERPRHDHPCDSLSVCLKGISVDDTLEGRRLIRPGDIVVRKAEHSHRQHVIDGPVFTLYVAKAWRREWGFATEQGWVAAAKYLAKEHTAVSLAIRTGID